MNLAFRHGRGAGRNWQEAIRACVQELDPVPPGASLGFVYFSDHLVAHAGAIVDTLRERTGVPHWVGSVGVGVIATGIEYLDEPAVVAMVGNFPPDCFRVFSGNSRPPAAGSRTANGAYAAHFAVVHADPGTEDVPGLIEDMSRKVESGFLVGGLSSSRSRALQVADEVLQGGLSGVVFSSDVAVATRLTQGCAPIRGTRGAGAPILHSVTACERNIIVTLDGRPSLEVFNEAAGPELAKDPDRAVHSVLVGLPVPGSDTGDYLVRNVVGIDPRHGMIAIGAPVELGMPVMFCRRGGTAAREDLKRMLDSISADAGAPPKAGLYYACIGRGEHMFGERSAELGLIRDALGDLPLVGFFASGEVSHDRLYGYTGVLTLFL
jgi:small ligand-binding sensory domain FIST